ncbi:hypothetical protein TPHA_0N01080 [Tetrapisispora phaffii CBS 4417]|uniref:UDP-N-acetylglucosamine--dolichyl-phosphate N-acetylglucosaminephosphotransferase n=1 Tax=Tetrapisispora phaffii (strain ATCC 24235 / CBS 4417 / NBRC 1672 / NRRL Y-8282 / UCD 70-5) TaxID=1071381 RepID=G8C161_TETPH|nr:hypothetical protein TPHA_0N01080 [Tetrapisispora phaffii CBS 4417]CCE65889.1 hypothetical protein TPHA_0N01080 [Tetrapisispora phaffii CBS 4417]
MATYFLLLGALGLLYCSKLYSSILASVGFSVIGYVVTDFLIPRVSPSFVKIGLFGKDLNKPTQPVIPETIGAVASTVYIFIMMFCIPFIFFKEMVTTVGGGHRDLSQTENVNGGLFLHNKLSEFLSGLLCLETTTLIGIADDLFDLRWRHKFLLPAVAAIPLLVVYYVDFGVTYVLIPKFMRKWLNGKTNIDLGSIYYLYMASMSIFCPNSINILAGVNGLEVGQSIVLGVIALLNDILYLSIGPEVSHEAHRLSIILITPFIGVSLALFKWNRWPARVFVGDTYCYFAGMVFAVVGILGHFSKTMLLLFIPQIVNFIYSCPQLFGLVFCPRHRLPKLNEKDGKLYPSRADLIENPPKKVFVPVLYFLHFCKLIDLEFETKDNKTIIKSCSNMTIINLTLVWLGPMREDKLCNNILAIQFITGLLSVGIRHIIGTILFGTDNLHPITSN